MGEVSVRAQEDRALLEAARGGDEAAFERLVAARRGELHAHCYRMLGSVHDAEDALQEALLRAWRGIERFEGRSSLRAWLYRIATNACLDAVARRPRRVLPVDYGPPADPHDSPGEPVTESVWIEPYPEELEDGSAGPEARYEQRESVELAFVAALQHLPPNQRAALLLREVLGFSAREAAEALDTTTASLNSALQRAREAMERRLPDRSQQATLRELGDARLAELVETYTTAMQEGDVDALVRMLAADAAWSMPPMPRWYRGHAAITAFLQDYPHRERWRHVPTRANGQLAVGCYMFKEDANAFLPGVLDVLTLRDDGRLAEVTAFVSPWVSERFGEEPGFMTPDAWRRFGLPDSLPA